MDAFDRHKFGLANLKIRAEKGKARVAVHTQFSAIHIRLLAIRRPQFGFLTGRTIIRLEGFVTPRFMLWQNFFASVFDTPVLSTTE